MPAAIFNKFLGDRTAAEVTPQEVEQWLQSRCKTAATANRYKAFISLCYRQGMRNGKVSSNPARLVQQQKESAGRLRFLTREEYNRVCKAIRKLFPAHLPEFVVSVNTGMRLSEQYSCTWSQVDMSRRAIDLTETKNGSARTIRLNPDALAAIESVRLPGQKPPDRVFPRQGNSDSFDTRSWFQPCLAEAKITGYVWHANRHTFCSWLAMAGATIKEIQELAGHKTITMSARYAHLSPDHKLSVIDRIAAAATKTATRPKGRTATKKRTALKAPTATITATSRKQPSNKNDHNRSKSFIFLVPRGGLEPPRPCGLRILSPFLASKHPPAQPRMEANNIHIMNDIDLLSTSHPVAPKCTKSRYKAAPKAAPGKSRKCFRIVRPADF